MSISILTGSSGNLISACQLFKSLSPDMSKSSLNTWCPLQTELRPATTVVEVWHWIGGFVGGWYGGDVGWCDG